MNPISIGAKSFLVGDKTICAIWAKEAIRRRDEIRLGKVQAIPGEKALAQVRRSVGR